MRLHTRIIGALLFAAGACHAAPDLAKAEDLIEEATNAFRAEQGLGRLMPAAKLSRAARGFAEFMARTDEYGHHADGSSPSDRAKRAGYDYCLVSENISFQYSSAEFETADLARRYVQGWKDSPGHRANMLEPDATDVAVAVAQSARTRKYYAVQLFGRPLSRSTEFRVTSAARRRFDYRVGGKPYSLEPRQARVHTTCGPPKVSFPAAGNGKGRMIRPSGGENLVVRGEGNLWVQAEPAPR
jgi:hypothetical protein